MPQSSQPCPEQPSRIWPSINFSKDLVLERKIGSGNFGTVYAARWLHAPPSVLATKPAGDQRKRFLSLCGLLCSCFLLAPIVVYFSGECT
jgi:hypothetical protein